MTQRLRHPISVGFRAATLVPFDHDARQPLMEALREWSKRVKFMAPELWRQVWIDMSELFATHLQPYESEPWWSSVTAVIKGENQEERDYAYDAEGNYMWRDPFDGCAWCQEPPLSVRRCQPCVHCHKLEHGAHFGRMWISPENWAKKEMIPVREDRKDQVPLGSLLLCADCVHEHRQSQTESGTAVVLDDRGDATVAQPCVAHPDTLTKGYIWNNGRMQFRCAECFSMLN